MLNPPHRPAELPIDAEAVQWNLPRNELPHALSTKPLLVIMHGFGSHEHDLLALVEDWGTDVLTASLRAPLPAGAGYAWFPLESRAEATTPDLPMANAAVAGVLSWLKSVRSLARTYGPVGLLGFSQGGAMATHLLRHFPEEFSCAAVLSGFTIQALVAGDEALGQIRPAVYWGRGAADPVIDAAAVARTRAFLSSHTTLTEDTFAGLGHGVTAQEAARVRQFLASHLAAKAN